MRWPIASGGTDKGEGPHWLAKQHAGDGEDEGYSELREGLRELRGRASMDEAQKGTVSEKE